MSTSKGVSRRRFLQGAAGIGLFTIVPRRALGGPGYTAPSEELTKAVIGVGGMGRNHLGYPGRLVAVCDVDAKHLQAALDAVESGVQGYHDFREVLARPDVDIVHIATPPHWHGLISIAAAKAGKDIWCEKPMTRTIGEGIKVVEAVQQYDRIFRLNTWFRFNDEFYGFKTTVQPIKKAVDSGLLGWPLRITVGAKTGFNWKLEQWSGRTDLVPEQIPEELDYDFWLGPAQHKPYHPHRVHQSFRGYWDYDAGGLGDMGQHYLDPVQYLLGKDDTGPVSVEVDSPQQHPDAVTPWRRIVLRYEDGCEIVLDGEGKEDVAYIEGPKGKLYPEMKSDIPNLLDKLRDFPEPEPQVGDFHQAVRNRTKFALNEANGHRSCSIINIASTAVRLGRNLKYDPAAQRFVGDDEANEIAHQPMRAPWHL